MSSNISLKGRGVNRIITSKVMLSPLAGVTDNIFRRLVRKWAPNSLLFTEMINATSLKKGYVTQKIKQKDLEDLISQSAPCASLDAHARGEEDRSTLGELIPDPNCEEPMEGMDRTIQKEHLGTWLSQLNEREQKIMKLRFGLDGEEPLTLAEIGRQINVSRERVRQLEAKAILKLRVMTTHQKAA